MSAAPVVALTATELVAVSSGAAGTSICGRDCIAIVRRDGHGVDMALKPTETLTEIRPPAGRYPTGPGVLLSSADFGALMDELESLRTALKARRGSTSGPTVARADLLAALESAGADEERIAQVAALIERASMLDDIVVVNGGAGLGSIIKVADRAGRTTEYELVGRTEGEPVREQVDLASATGKALLGARPGDRVRVTHANGRQRRVRVVNVVPALAAGLRARLEAGDVDAPAQR